MVRCLFLFIFLLIAPFSFAQNNTESFDHLLKPVRNYIVYQTISEIKIDGNPDEISWEKAKWSEYFGDIEGEVKPKPLYQTRFKMLWDDKNLYILAELEEPHIWCYYTNHDQIVYHENDFEIFIDPDRSTHNYFEFEINAQNTLFDLFMPKPYRNGGHAEIDWNMKGFKSAVSVDGTLNNADDKDQKWTIEVAIPFKHLSHSGKYEMPKDGSYWKINFSRVQWQTEVVNGIYQKVKDKNSNKYINENNWVWSPQGVVNMHYPERWGLAQFSTKTVEETPVEFKILEEEIWTKYLWLVYYKQKEFKQINGKYSETFSELNLKQETKTKAGSTFFYKIEVKNETFTIWLQNENGLKLSVNQDGLFKTITN